MLEHSYWGVLVKSLKSGETLYALNSRRLMMPASNMKIVTLAAAAERLGWDYTYDTQVFAAGEIESGTLRGDLIVVGSGDPSVTDKEAEALFAEWAERLKSSGVRTIIGRIVGDDDAFEDNGLRCSTTRMPSASRLRRVRQRAIPPASASRRPAAGSSSSARSRRARRIRRQRSARIGCRAACASSCAARFRAPPRQRR